jgi:hypothetical protein
MDFLIGVDPMPARRRSQLRREFSLLSTILMVMAMAWVPRAYGQIAESANLSRPSLWAGGGASGFYLQYGERKMLGVTGFVDADSAHRIGLEGEGRWLEFRQTANVHAESYLIGPRYHISLGRFQPYVKGLVGVGDFNFPYNYAHGSYLVVAAGGGVDYRLSRRWSARLADVEYQDWPEFTFGAMTSVGVTSGIRFRVF